MKDKLTDEVRLLYVEARKWWHNQVDYVKLTAAEKFTILVSALVVGAVCMFISTIALVLFSFALVEVFKDFLCPALAYTCVGGVFIILCILIVIFRRPLVLNPIARFITRLIIDKSK
ncbi:MAG: hypothetical protein NC201_00940 [Prevotella sp.]|nr:hypothetical protein [Bacteroides sp.]MCM1365792.1 hypothetical protein [Prevotella sp.]MCM1436516.1 hypothetical protein [Prevotella sp.]